MHAERIGNGDQDTDAQVRLGCLDALQEGQVDAGAFSQPLLCHPTQCTKASRVGGNVQQERSGAG
jgi:hypothetical protein